MLTYYVIKFKITGKERGRALEEIEAKGQIREYIPPMP